MQNYTMLGFQKTKIPNYLLDQLTTFWNMHSHKQQKEVWDKYDSGASSSSSVSKVADTHVNHWESPTHMVHIDNPYFEGGGMELKNQIWHVARQSLQEWINNGGGGGGGDDGSIVGDTDTDTNTNAMNGDTTKRKQDESPPTTKYTLSPTSLYGIRVYKSKSILAPHVDRLPLVTSAIINVAQDVDEDWPLEVIGHDGVAYNITMEPGDMVLYESHSVIHGMCVVCLCMYMYT